MMAELKELSGMEVSDEELTAWGKENLLRLIDEYANSEAVNHIVFSGQKTWLTPEVRSNYLASLTAAEALGETSISFEVNGQVFELPIATAKTVLYKIQRYADATYMVTVALKAAAEALETMADVSVFAYKEGYPEELRM